MLDRHDTVYLLVGMNELTQELKTIEEFQELLIPGKLEKRLNGLYPTGGRHTQAQLELGGKMLERMNDDYQAMEKTGQLGHRRYYGMFAAHYDSLQRESERTKKNGS
jgi:hypothetical protein